MVVPLVVSILTLLIPIIPTQTCVRHEQTEIDKSEAQEMDGRHGSGTGKHEAEQAEDVIGDSGTATVGKNHGVDGSVTGEDDQKNKKGMYIKAFPVNKIDSIYYMCSMYFL